MKSKKFLLGIPVVLLVFGMMVVGCSSPTGSDGGDNSSGGDGNTTNNDSKSGYAPQSLARGYIFALTPGGNTNYTVEYWIWTATQGFSPSSTHSNDGKNYNLVPTPYTYIKTGPNTASFKYAIDQYNVIGVEPYRYWVYTGTLTYTSATECNYVFTNTYQGAPQGSGTKKFYVRIDPSAVYLPY